MANINFTTYYNVNMLVFISKVYIATNRDFMLPGIAITASIKLVYP